MFFTSHLRNLPIVKTVEEKMEAFAQRPEVTEKRIITPSESLQGSHQKLNLEDFSL